MLVKPDFDNLNSVVNELLKKPKTDILAQLFGTIEKREYYYTEYVRRPQQISGYMLFTVWSAQDHLDDTWDWASSVEDRKLRAVLANSELDSQDFFAAQFGWPCYGVCDSPEQFSTTEAYQKMVDSPLELFVCMSQILKKDHHDFRWHKNGVYIGNKYPQYEHLGEEKDIDEIWLFDVFVHVGKTNE